MVVLMVTTFLLLPNSMYLLRIKCSTKYGFMPRSHDCKKPSKKDPQFYLLPTFITVRLAINMLHAGLNKTLSSALTIKLRGL